MEATGGPQKTSAGESVKGRAKNEGPNPFLRQGTPYLCPGLFAFSWEPARINLCPQPSNPSIEFRTLCIPTNDFVQRQIRYQSHAPEIMIWGWLRTCGAGVCCCGRVREAGLLGGPSGKRSCRTHGGWRDNVGLPRDSDLIMHSGVDSESFFSSENLYHVLL